jgi:hypothetical protein
VIFAADEDIDGLWFDDIFVFSNRHHARHSPRMTGCGGVIA